MSFCPNCGKEVQSEAAFCNSCGHSLRQASQVKQSSISQGNSLGKAVIIALVFIGIISTIFIGFLFVNAPKELSASSKTISIYVDTLPYEVDPTYSNALREAQAYWEKKQNVVFKEVSSQNEADVIVKWVKEFGGKTLGHTVYKNFIEIGLGDSNCLGKWKPYKYKTVSYLATHELGHALGYEDDYSNAPNVMYYQTTTSYETDIEETDILQDGYTMFYPVCTKNSVATYSFEVTSSEPLNIYIVASRQNYELFANDKTFSHYSACQGNKVENYKNTCTISSESGIALENPTTFGLGASARYTVKIKEI